MPKPDFKPGVPTRRRPCPRCKKPVQGRARQAVYCSVGCRLAAQNDRRREQWQAVTCGPMRSECWWCEKELPEAGRWDMVFCSVRCRVAHHRRRKKALEEERRRRDAAEKPEAERRAGRVPAEEERVVQLPVRAPVITAVDL